MICIPMPTSKRYPEYPGHNGLPLEYTHISGVGAPQIDHCGLSDHMPRLLCLHACGTVAYSKITSNAYMAVCTKLFSCLVHVPVYSLLSPP